MSRLKVLQGSKYVDTNLVQNHSANSEVFGSNWRLPGAIRRDLTFGHNGNCIHDYSLAVGTPCLRVSCDPDCGLASECGRCESKDF